MEGRDMVLRDMVRRSLKNKPRFITSRRITSRSIMSRLAAFLTLKKSGHKAFGLAGLARLRAGADPGLHRLRDRHALPVAHQLLLYPDRAGARRQYGRGPSLDAVIELTGLDQPVEKAAPI